MKLKQQQSLKSPAAAKTIVRRLRLALWTCAAVLAVPAFASAQEKGTSEAKRPPVNLSIKGAEVRQLKGIEAGRPLSVLPGVKTITREELQVQKDVPKTGLFLVDLDHIPRGLEKGLKDLGLRLKADGSLFNRKGKPATLFIRGGALAIAPQRKSESQGVRSGGFSLQKWLISEAQAASPVPWRCLWWWSYARIDTDSSFSQTCTAYVSGTQAETGGLDPAGGCGDDAPYTKIQFLRVQTRTTSPEWHNANRYCYNCDKRKAEAAITRCHSNFFGSATAASFTISGIDSVWGLDGATYYHADWAWDW
jgi:hypothetical protein